jgi:DNA transformation protein
MPNRPAFIEFLFEQFAPLGAITARPMMGGHTLYCDEVVFALVANNEVYLKADVVNQPSFVARGLEAFRPFPNQPGVMQYYQAPPEIFEDREALRIWAGGAIEAGRRARAKGKPRPRK